MIVLLAQQDPVAANPSAFFFGQIIGGLVVGLLGGLLVKKVADRRGQEVVGWIGFGITLVAGVLFGLIGAVPSAVLFGVIAAVMPDRSRKKRGKATESGGTRFGPPRPPSQPYEL